MTSASSRNPKPEPGSGTPPPIGTLYVRAAGHRDGGVEMHLGDVVTVGRDPHNKVQVSHQSVAEFHCRIAWQKGGMFAEPMDGQSVRVGNKLVRTRVTVGPGSEITVGSIRLSLSSSPPAHATTAPSFQDQLRKEFRLVLRRTPWFLLSVGAHLVLLLILRNIVFTEKTEERIVAVRSGSMLPVEPLTESDDSPEFTPEDPEDSTVEPDLESTSEDSFAEFPTLDPVDFDASSSEWQVGVGGGGHGGGGLDGGRRLLLGDGMGEEGLVSNLRSIRGAGLDVMFVIDTTTSMVSFLNLAKDVVDKLVTRLAAVVPDLRIGIVAFRDYTDEYVTVQLDLSDDRYEILNFLMDLDAMGGGDVEEAILEAFQAARHQASWRDGTRRVVMLIGDAPPHTESWNQLRNEVKAFRKERGKGNSLVSAVFTGTSYGMRNETIQAFGQIAQLGGGTYVELSEMDAADQLLATAVGRDDPGELAKLLENVQLGLRSQIVKRRFADGNVTWLMQKLQRAPVHPDVVNALRILADRRVLMEIRNILVDEKKSLPVRRACQYILRKELGDSFGFDPVLPVSVQRDSVEAITAAIRTVDR